MVYLVRMSTNKVDDKGNEYLSYCLKVGYTKEVDGKTRFRTYYSYNNCFKCLYTIPDATWEDEQLIHDHLSSHRCDSRREWYEYDDEIIEFFKTHTTHESLRELGVYVSPLATLTNGLIIKERLRPYIYAALSVREGVKDPSSFLDDIEELENHYLFDLGKDFTDKDIEELVFNEYPDYAEYLPNIWNYWKDQRQNKYGYNIPDDLWNFLTNVGGNFRDKLKSFVEYTGLDRLDKLSLSYKISPKIGYYYNNLDELTIRRADFTQAKMDTYIAKKNLDTSLDIKNNIINSFIVGNRYLRSDIKNTLLIIYRKYDPNMKPKASDLEKWFELKDVLIHGSRGYEILKLK